MLITKKFIVYRNTLRDEVLEGLLFVMENYRAVCSAGDGERKNRLLSLYLENVGLLVDMAVDYGFEGNLWHNYLTYLLVNDENPFSMACEIDGKADGSLNDLARHDFDIFREMFQEDFQELDASLGTEGMTLLADYKNMEKSGRLLNRRISERIRTLSRKLEQAQTTDEFMADVVGFYREFGVGNLGLHKAFRIKHIESGNPADSDEPTVRIEPVTNIAHVHLDDLVGYEIAKKKLVENTEAFLNGKPANNCLLYGDAGTGKSSSIKGILNQYYDQGLRIIEVYKHQFQDLNDVVAQIKNRNYKFIIYMDDLSFEDFETEYKYLKAVIEGGLEKKPDNILIYATSNRRHLVREKFSDKEDRRDDLHSSDTVQEKLSLVNRFGVQIFFCAPEKKEFQNIVKVLADRYGIVMPEEELLLEANKWELSHGGMTGRTAQQFIDYLRGTR